MPIRYARYSTLYITLHKLAPLLMGTTKISTSAYSLFCCRGWCCWWYYLLPALSVWPSVLCVFSTVATVTLPHWATQCGQPNNQMFGLLGPQPKQCLDCHIEGNSKGNKWPNETTKTLNHLPKLKENKIHALSLPTYMQLLISDWVCLGV